MPLFPLDLYIRVTYFFFILLNPSLMEGTEPHVCSAFTLMYPQHAMSPTALRSSSLTTNRQTSSSYISEEQSLDRIMVRYSLYEECRVY